MLDKWVLTPGKTQQYYCKENKQPVDTPSEFRRHMSKVEDLGKLGVLGQNLGYMQVRQRGLNAKL